MADKHWLIFLVLLIVFAGISFTVKDNIRENPGLVFSQGETLENFSLPDTGGNTIALQDYISEHRLTWVNFWATWCGPCRREMPMMAELYEEYSDEGFGIVAVSVEETRETVLGYLDSNPVPFTVLLDTSGTVSRSYGIRALPSSFLVDSTGRVLQTGVGFQQSWEILVSQRMEDN